MLIFIFANLSLGQDQISTLKIKGWIYDHENKTPLKNANVYLVGESKGTITDEVGYFEINNVTAGHHKIKVAYIGYKTVTIDTIIEQSARQYARKIFLEPVPIPYNEIGVSASRYSIKGGNTMLRGIDMEHQPNPFDDALRSIQALPGIISNGYDGSFYVRGGSQNELLVEIDGHRIDRPFHFEQYPFGPVNSLISYHWIENMEFSSGGFSARYGDKMSGILQIYSKNPINNADSNSYYVKASGGIDFLNTQGVLEGSRALANGSKIGCFFTVRRGHIDQVLRITDSLYPYDVSYYDAFGKIIYQPNQQQTFIVASLFGSDYLRDRQKSGDNSQQPDSTAPQNPFVKKKQPTEQVDYQSFYNWLQWKWLISPQVLCNTVLYIDQHPKSFCNNEENDQLYLNRHAKLWGCTFASDIQLTSDWFISTGGEFSGFTSSGYGKSVTYTQSLFYDLDIDGIFLQAAPFDTLENIEKNSSFRLRGYKAAFYLTTGINITPKLAFETGIRWDYTKITKQLRWSPRFSLKFQPLSFITFRFATGRYDQSPDITDFNFSHGERKLELSQNPKVEQAYHCILGMDTQFSPSLFLRTEAYLKNYVKLSNQSFTSDIPLFNTLYGSPDRGKSMGLETFMRYSSEYFSWWCSYSLAKTQIHTKEIGFQAAGSTITKEGGWFIRRFDQRHTLTAVLDYSWSPEWHVGVQLISHSGRPYTDIFIDDAFSKRTDGWFEIYQFKLHTGEIQGSFYPAHIQLDVKFRRRFTLKNYQFDTYIGILNLLNRKNIDGIEGFPEITFNGAQVTLVRNYSEGILMTPFIGIYCTF